MNESDTLPSLLSQLAGDGESPSVEFRKLYDSWCKLNCCFVFFNFCIVSKTDDIFSYRCESVLSVFTANIENSDFKPGQVELA